VHDRVAQVEHVDTLEEFRDRGHRQQHCSARRGGGSRTGCRSGLHRRRPG
jgi:hypothetical protein